MSWKLREELRRRGRGDATAVFKEPDLQGKKDGALFKALSREHVGCVLVTWDNSMPQAHSAELDHFGITLAVVNQDAFDGLPAEEEAYYRDTVHRWLHVIERQAEGERRRYSPWGHAAIA